MSRSLFPTPRRNVHAMALPEKPDNLDRQIAQLLKQAQADTADDPPPEPLDEATLRRVMNGLRTRGAFDAPPADAAQPSKAGLRGLASWLRPGNVPSTSAAAGARPGAAATRTTPGWILPAAFATALLLTLVWAGRGGSPGPVEPAGIKSGNAAKIDPAAPLTVVYSEDPLADAAKLGEQMALLGVPAAMTQMSDGVTLRAQVPPALQLRASEALQNEGLALPLDGQVAVHFKLLK